MADRKFDRLEKLFKFKSFWWQPEMKITGKEGKRLHNTIGPFCSACKAKVKSDDENHSLKAECLNCSKKYNLEYPLNVLKQRAYIAYEAKMKEGFKLISLELPPDLIIDKAENKDYWIEARLGQKNGNLMAVIYMGKKLGKQTKKDYVQMFVDIDDEQVRFDKGNKNPLNLLSTVEVNFSESKTVIEKKKENKPLVKL